MGLRIATPRTKRLLYTKLKNMFHLFQQVNTHKSLVPRLFQEQGTKTGTFQEQHWNTLNVPLTSRNAWNMFQGDYFSSRKNERHTMANPVPVTRVSDYAQDDLKVFIRQDLRRTRFAFIAAPPQFVADAEQLRTLADALHDMADQLDTEK